VIDSACKRQIEGACKSACKSDRWTKSAYVSIRQHTSANATAYVSIQSETKSEWGGQADRDHTPAYVSIRKHTSAYVSIRQHTSAYRVGGRESGRTDTETLSCFGVISDTVIEHIFT
jgi:hypothetical protein